MYMKNWDAKVFFFCHRIFKLKPRWDIGINLPWDYEVGLLDL
jgi:hypothetical protein